jgi:hypothetical protein
MVTLQGEAYNIEILNVLGEKIYFSTVNGNKINIDISGEPKGIYFIKLRTAQGLAVKKIVIR